MLMIVLITAGCVLSLIVNDTASSQPLQPDLVTAADAAPPARASGDTLVTFVQ